MKDLPLTWREFLKILVRGIDPDSTALNILESTPGSDWDQVLKALRSIKRYNLGGLLGLRNLMQDETELDDDLSQQSPEKRLFFLIEYQPKEVIMQRGAYSDYAALHLQGAVRVWLDAPPTWGGAAKSCWDAPLVPRSQLGSALLRLLPFSRRGRSLPTAPLEKAAALVGQDQADRSKLLPPARGFADRLMGVTSVIWKQPRTATLIAENDNEGNACRMVLIKRIFLRQCLLFADGQQKQLSPLYEKKVEIFVDQSLPGLLAQNRLFRPLFYVEEVKKWAALLDGLALKGDTPVTLAKHQIAGLLLPDVRQWMRALAPPRPDEADKYRIVSELNDLLDRSDLYDAKVWPRDTLQPEERELLDQRPRERTVVETYRLNRLLIEAAFPAVFQTIRNSKPRTREDFTSIVNLIRTHPSWLPLPERPREGDIIFQEGTPANELYLILEGRVRLTLKAEEDRIPFNHLVENGFFGEDCIREKSDDPEPIRLYKVEALTNCNLLKLGRLPVEAIATNYPDFKNKLIWESARMRRRAEQVRLGHRLPPVDVPPDMAAKLMRATNLLVIDMERCTRCDQCVQACTASHQGHPRFHRANPDFRMGRWEIAGACVHCCDAPCLEGCPVGAITLLENGSVQVLRDRCISCRKCERACPFGVIEYHPPIDKADGSSAKEDDFVVAHKCDLCLTPEREPPCVVACPYGAAMRGAPSGFFPGLKSMARFTSPM
jgi:Fe-S-cluster-containing hydrogenase component 2/CRP-like cAMP-binding protein